MLNKREMIAFCGLYCGECSNQTGLIADLARDLRKELRSVRFDKTAKTLSELSFFSMFSNYEQCYDVLGRMVNYAVTRHTGEAANYKDYKALDQEYKNR